MPALTPDEFSKFIQEFDTTLMTARGRDGHLHTRPMASQKPLEDSPLWFAASLDSGKIADLKADPQVNLGYYRASDRAWISVAGRARLDTDRAKIKQLWQEDWRIWFPDGPEQSDIVLIHVVAEHITYWKPEHGRIGQVAEMVTSYFTGKQPDMEPVQTRV